MGRSLASLYAFLIAAVSISLLMFALSFMTAYTREQFVGRLRGGVFQVKKVGGGILVLVGLWLVILGLFAEYFARIFPV